MRGEREFFIDNLLVRFHFIIVMIRWTGLAPWEFEFPFPGSLTSTFLVYLRGDAHRIGAFLWVSVRYATLTIPGCWVQNQNPSPCLSGPSPWRPYRGTSLIRNTPPVGTYNSPMPRDLWWS